MKEKAPERDWRTITISAVMGALLVVIPATSVKIYESITKEEKEAVVENVVSYEPEDFNALIASFYDSSLSATQMQESLNEYLKFYPEFETEIVDEGPAKIGKSRTRNNEEDKGPGESVAITIEMRELMTAYLDGLFIQQNRLEKIVSQYTEPFKKLEAVSGEILKNDVHVVEGLKSPVVDGVMREMHNTPLHLYSDEGNYSVWVDYDEILDIYDKYMNSFHKNLVRLHKDVMRFGYTRADGEIDAKVIYNRLMLLDDIQESYKKKDDFYWENERYQLAVLFTGYGADERPKWDNKRIEQMKDIAANSTEKNPYSEIAAQLVASIQEEDGYGDETVRVANNWMHKEFDEYSKHIEELTDDANES